ncbi:FtsK/SpoIIIE domain-containing protein [Pseudarthrobacter sp. IC2-21]|uniref:FtsK/SpoIIIE domain-containing protein n=1 Tax=Pseudarthrobacter sp. IC2-21 TaxID=3092262 RepID=UPI002A6AF8A7|nr:FtsK/SpoIIIE domain-containing protein [Pseudarthrobacter sp. IC2-21]
MELTIEGPDGAAGADLQKELTSTFGAGSVSIDDQELSSLQLGLPPLVNGAILVDAAGTTARRPRQRPPEPPASLALAVHSGAGAGLVVPLRRGSYTIGRNDADIVIPDPDMSRAHARLVVTETTIMIEDLGSANGTEVDGARQRNAIITTNSTIRCGNSTMSLVLLEQPDNQLHDAGADVREPIILRRPVDPANRAALLLTAILPVLLGVGLAAITGMWMFLAFTAVSAVSVLVPVIGGRRQRRELAAAVCSAVSKDQSRRRRAAPALSALTIGGGKGRNRDARDSSSGVWLRLGQAVQPANLTFEPPDPARVIPSGGMLPVTLDPARPLTSISGPGDLADGLARSFLMQFAGYPLGSDSRIVVHGIVDRMPLAARFLNNVTLASRPAAARTLLQRGFRPSHRHGVLVLLGTSNTSGIIDTALEHGWQVIHFHNDGELPFTADIQLGERRSEFSAGTERIRFLPDLAPAGVFEGFCRRLAKHTDKPGRASESIPMSCRLWDLLPASTDEVARRWTNLGSRHGLVVPLGIATGGMQALDIQSDGPHLLVAGTTGSGKSELLRSLTVALALSYPPDRVNFLFVDFKGGSGLGPLTGLPHCVGMLTDLSSHELERYLQSLGAEIRFREELLAAAQAPDLTSYRAAPAGLASPLPHLVIVIDEFRMLVEDAPETLHELMKIAAIGRSLGIHLIMATQRPQGALTADIRANVTTSIALRVQSEMESMDIINSKAAAGISVDNPGRAYLARGTESPIEFQSGSLTAEGITSPPARLSVHLASDYIDRPPTGDEPAAAGAERTPAQAIMPLIAALSDVWDAMNRDPVRKPVSPPLPCVLPWESAPPDQDSARRNGWSVRLGLMDLPSEQRTAPLIWEPAGHGHLALVGGTESGAAEAIGLAVRSLACHPRESHLYILDHGGSFAGLASNCRVGARAGLHELRRAVRIVERLAKEQLRRLADPAADATPLVLVISAWGSWVSAFRAGPLAWAEDLVHDLVRDDGTAGITVIISGQRELVTARFFAAIPSRVYFPAGSSEESRVAWPNLPATPSVTGRAVAMGTVSAGKTAVCQFYSAGPDVEGPGGGHRITVSRRPFRVEPLPVVVPAAYVLKKAGTAGQDNAPALTAYGMPGEAGQKSGLLLIGVGGDELEPVSVTAPTGGVLAVLGASASGKSAFLRLLPTLNPAAGPWLRPGSTTPPTAYWPEILKRASTGGLAKGSVALVDDADLLPSDVNRQLAELNMLGITVVITAGFSPTLSQRVPLALHARSQCTGVLIAPRTFLDGDLFGVRFEAEPNPPPGRSVLIQNGRAVPVQLGWVPPG